MHFALMGGVKMFYCNYFDCQISAFIKRNYILKLLGDGVRLIFLRFFLVVRSQFL